jgi:hypothetical protein
MIRPMRPARDVATATWSVGAGGGSVKATRSRGVAVSAWRARAPGRCHQRTSMLTTVVRLSSLLPNGRGGADSPDPDELAPRRIGTGVLAPVRRTSRPRGLFVVEGGSQCPEGPFCAAGSAASCSGPVFFCPSKSAPAFLLLPSCSSKPLSRLLEGGKPSLGNSIPAGQRPVGMVGVTGFEPAASSSRTTSRGVANGR